MLSRVGSKLGTGAAILIGGVVGRQLRKQHETVQQISEISEKFDYERAVLSSENEGTKTLSNIYQGLKEFTSTSVTENPIAEFYTEVAKIQCQRYLLHQRREVDNGLDLWLSEWVTEAEWVDSVDFWPHPPTRSALTAPSYSAALCSSMRSLWYISCCRDFCKGNRMDRLSVFNYDVVNRLKQVIEEGDTKAAPMALKVVANIAVHQENHQLIHDTGMVDVLTACANHHHPYIFLPAWRGLHNLKTERSKASKCSEVFMEGIYPYMLPEEKKQQKPLLDIVLVHGIEGGAPWTWRQRDGETHRPLLPQNMRRQIKTLTEDVLDQYTTCCWPLDWLVPALGLPVRVIALDFRAHWWRWGCASPEESIGKSLAKHSQELTEALEAAGVGQRPIVWVTHSMGGLLVKHILMAHTQSLKSSDGSLARRTVATVFFSVPHHGSPLATAISTWPLSNLLQPTCEVREMRTDNPLLKVMHESFLSLVKEQQVAVLSLVECEPTQHVLPGGWELQFVLPDQADPGVGEFCEVETTHRDICKPLDRKGDAYQKLLLFLKENLNKM